MANPASVNCETIGGSTEIKKNADGGEYGMCTFTNGTSCEEWALYRGEGCTTTGQHRHNNFYLFYSTGSARYPFWESRAIASRSQPESSSWGRLAIFSFQMRRSSPSSVTRFERPRTLPHQPSFAIVDQHPVTAKLPADLRARGINYAGRNLRRPLFCA